MYYSGNRYLTIDEMKVNAQYVYNYFSASGWTKNAICGILGNMQTESTINPALWEGLDNTNLMGGFGIVQWTPSTKFTVWCSDMDLNPNEMDSNLKRILYEVANNAQWGNDSLGNPPPYSFSEFTKSTEPPYTLAMNFLHYYERPAVYDQPDRGTQADYWFSYLNGTTPPDPSQNYPKASKSKPYKFITNKRRIFIL
jgi:hypothetical protein